MEHHRRLLFFAELQIVDECFDDLETLRNQDTTFGTVCGKRQARSHKGDMQELGYTRS